MKITMLLADYAKVSDGKLDILGGGWSVTNANTPPSAIALYLQIPWDRANLKHKIKLDLLDADGNIATVDTDEGEKPVAHIEGEFEVGRPPGMKPGTPIDAPRAIPIPPLQLQPGQRYEWRLTIDDRGDEDWTLPFSTRPASPQSMAA
jgi:hypothetical protein